MKHAIRHIHFVGLGGAGMSGIAEVLFNLGYRISGSDLSDSPTLHPSAGLGIATHLGHAADHIAGPMPWSRPRLSRPTTRGAGRPRKKIPWCRAPSCWPNSCGSSGALPLPGTHGKTTTTSLVTSVLAEAGWIPPL